MTSSEIWHSVPARFKGVIINWGVWFALGALPNLAWSADCSGGISDAEILTCANSSMRAAEKRLNDTYQRTLRSFTPETEKARVSLVLAERAWVKFRAADCSAWYDRVSSGTGQLGAVTYAGYMQTHAERRIKELEDFERH